MRTLWIILVLTHLLSCDQGWQPSEDPDPQLILREAQTDKAEGRYQEALDKHVWFHEHALSLRPALYGVRLSFALNYWYELGLEYPRAMTRLNQVRQETLERILIENEIHNLFHDYLAINRTFQEDSLTSLLFLQLDTLKPELANRVFNLAQPALIQAGEYRVCGKYLEPEEGVTRLIMMLQTDQEYADSTPDRERILEHGRKRFMEQSATMIALLVINDQKADAENAARKFQEFYSDSTFAALMNSALEGILPNTE